MPVRPDLRAISRHASGTGRSPSGAPDRVCRIALSLHRWHGVYPLAWGACPNTNAPCRPLLTAPRGTAHCIFAMVMITYPVPLRSPVPVRSQSCACVTRGALDDDALLAVHVLIDHNHEQAAAGPAFGEQLPTLPALDPLMLRLPGRQRDWPHAASSPPHVTPPSSRTAHSRTSHASPGRRCSRPLQTRVCRADAPEHASAPADSSPSHHPATLGHPIPSGGSRGNVPGVAETGHVSRRLLIHQHERHGVPSKPMPPAADPEASPSQSAGVL